MTMPLSSTSAARSFVPASATPTLSGGGGDDGLRKAAEQFEAVILRQLMASMRQANFREMADARTADSLAAMRQFGIADLVERQFRGRLGGAGGAVQ
jgi:peptidoglycan hydrolase FlgJ